VRARLHAHAHTRCNACHRNAHTLVVTGTRAALQGWVNTRVLIVTGARAG